jgi:hypothetical protein
MHFFHFIDTCYLSFNGSTKFLKSIVILDSFFEPRRAVLALVLKCYAKEGALIKVAIAIPI